MNCLMCGKDLFTSGTIEEILFRDDLLCSNCRSKWVENKKDIKLGPYIVKSSWEYNDAFRSTLIQYKECYDEALKDVFLYPERKKIRHYLRGYTLILMPSTKEKLEERGFSHLKFMFSSLKLPMLEPFITESNQKGKTLKERKEIGQTMYLKENIHLPYKIALVDDVYTTGSTLRAALSNIDAKTHKIKIYTVARVPILE